MELQVHPFRLEIDVGAHERYGALERIYTELREVKHAQFGPETSDPEPRDEAAPDAESVARRLRAWLDAEAVEHFAAAFDYDGEEGRVWAKLWALTPYARRSDPIFTVPGPWSFEAVIAGIYSGEYLLEPLVRVSHERAILTYEALAGPFGGTAPLVQLVEAFGQIVVFDSCNEGPPYRPRVGWDYARATRLVAAGRGV